jgi:hypothetical protein
VINSPRSLDLLRNAMFKSSDFALLGFENAADTDIQPPYRCYLKQFYERTKAPRCKGNAIMALARKLLGSFTAP